MPTYRFTIRKYIREHGIANNFVDLVFTDSEYSKITADFCDSSKISGFVSSKVGKGVVVVGFPVKIADEIPDDSQQHNLVFPVRRSRLRRMCAIPLEFMLKLII